MTGLFQKTLQGVPHDRPPVWFMRQAGRYHSHYQAIRKAHSFLNICRTPEIACDVAMGPIDDFDFDAAILFSDILFPIEAMGIDLDFSPGPVLSHLLRSPEDMDHYRPCADFADFIGFQGEAIQKTRAALPKDKSLLGFIGGPLTLYIFAVEGTAQKVDFSASLYGFIDGRFMGFMDRLLPMLWENLALQADAGADTLAILDSCAGLIPEDLYVNTYLPILNTLIDKFQATHPHVPILYYGKDIGPRHWGQLPLSKLAALGIDHSQDLPLALSSLPQASNIPQTSSPLAVQGNFPPMYMSLPPDEFAIKFQAFLDTILALPAADTQRWICGLGHGITPMAIEENVRTFVQGVQDIRLPQP